MNSSHFLIRTRSLAIGLVCAVSTLALAAGLVGPPAANAETTPPDLTLPDYLTGTQIFPPAPASMVNLAGIDVGATAYFSSCQQRVWGTSFNMASLESVGVYAAAASFDVSSGIWTWSNWTPADGITEYAVPSRSPYLYELVVYARYEGGWNFVSQWVQVEPEIDNGFCP